MEHDNWGTSQRQGMAVLLALTALVAVPLAAPAAATAAPIPVSAQALFAQTAAGSTVESPADATVRTTGTLAAVAIGAVALVGLWWYLVVRHRRRD